MKRHKFNICPEAKAEDYQRLRQDIEASGYDETQPIMLYQGDILDGWNRQKACDELGVAARYQHFVGDPKTDLNLHPNSPGYRLILNNVLFPAAKKKERKT